jgi:DNA-binding XRE family transcriptional regulator
MFYEGTEMKKKKEFVLETHQDVLKYFLKDPEIKKAYDNLETDDQVKRALIELRINLKETQKKLAEKLDTKQAYISRVERGGVSPTVSYIAKMANALNADAEIIFRPRGSKKVIKAVLVKERASRKYKPK